MKNVDIVANLLDRIRADYQFDHNDENYLGFLNVDPSQDWTTEEGDAFLWLLENDQDVLENMLMERGLEIESYSQDEVVFYLTEQPFVDYSLNQGRRPDQVEFSEKMVAYSLTAIVILTVAYFLWQGVK